MANPFGSKKAAPFVAGGGRSQDHPNDATGKPRPNPFAKKAAAMKKNKKG